MLHISYTNPSFPNCTLYGYHDATTGSGINVKVVAMAVSIPVASIVIFVIFLTAIILVFMCFAERVSRDNMESGDQIILILFH